MRPPELAGIVRAAASARRLGMEARGGALLAAFVDGFLELAAGAPRLAAELGPLVAAITAAQERNDPVGLADLLEHELAPALERASY